VKNRTTEETRTDETNTARSRRRGGYLLGRVNRAMARSFESLMKNAGLGDIGNGEGRLVYLLWRNGPLRQGELAAKAGIDKSTLTLTLSKMERKGLVDRRPDEGDGRGVIVSVSKSAAIRADAFELVSSQMNELFFRGVSDAEIDVFEEMLERILVNLESTSAD